MRSLRSLFHRSVVGALFVAASACSKSSTEAAPPAPSVSALPTTSATPVASVAPTVKAGLVTFRGQGQLEVGDLYVPGKGEVPNAKEWENTKWRGDETSTNLGAVTFELTVDEATGKLWGSLDGASGPAVLNGTMLGPRVSATITRKDPSDQGLTGLFVATREGDALKGTLRLSIGTARILRKGELTGKRAP